MADPFEQWASGYQPRDTMIPVNVSGIQNPANTAELARAQAYGNQQGQQDAGQAQVQRLSDTPFAKVLSAYTQGNATIDDLTKAANLQRSIMDSPQKVVSVLQEILVPAMDEYTEEYKPTKKPFNLIVGALRNITPEYLRPKAKHYFNLQTALKLLMAKGLFPNPGNLTEADQQNPLAILPTDYDDPELRQNSISDFKKLLQQYR